MTDFTRRRLFRRGAIVAGLAAGAALAVVGSAAASAHSPTALHHASGPRPTIVLVHGAWANGSSWNGVVQRLRVGAANGLGVKYLARKDAKTVGILGSGWQAGAQLMAVCAVRDIQTIRCFSPNPENRDMFAATMSALLGVRVDPVAEPEAAIKGADIVMCASNSIDHIFFERWIEPGMHLSSIKRPEIEVKAIKRADRVIIHWNDPAPIHVAAKGVVIEERVEGRGWQLAEEIDFKQLATLPELMLGRVGGRTSDADVTCFINNIGLGFQFAAAGALVYRKAKESGLGHELPTDWFTEDVHP